VTGVQTCALPIYGPAYAFTKKYLRQDEADRAMSVFEKELMDWRLRAKDGSYPSR
jgi:hypothetical protein